MPSILIVDDDQLVARALGNLLQQDNFQPVAFHNGLAALTWAKDHKPDAAIVDIHLPDLNGLVLSQKLREVFGPKVPIIVLSGDSSMEVVNSLTLVGATYFFSKPVDPQTLLDRLKEFMK